MARMRGCSLGALVVGVLVGLAQGPTAQADEEAPPALVSPEPGIYKPGFIDHSDGAHLRSGPAEVPTTRTLTPAVLPPTTRVFVSGTYPGARDWFYVTALIDGHLVRGYVQKPRVTMDLPEPLAWLHAVKEGDRLEPLATRIYRGHIQPGRDLRFYENVILHVNAEAGRAGVRRGAEGVELVAGHRIWLVRPTFADRLQGIVSSGSITGGALARARETGQPLEDILAAIARSPEHLTEVAGEYASVIREHLPEIIGIVGLFLSAEGLSMSLAATPTGAGQLAAAAIQLCLGAFGAKAMVDGTGEAVRHAEAWLVTAWQAHGDRDQIAEASRSFVRMVVSVALVVLSTLGTRANLERGLKLAQGVEITLPRLASVEVAGTGERQLVLLSESTTAPSAAGGGPNALTGLGAATGKVQGEAREGAKEAAEEAGAASAAKAAEELGEEALEALETTVLQKTPNWERVKDFIGRRLPEAGTPEFQVVKRELEAAGYQLDVLTEGSQPFRLRRIGDKAEAAPITVTKEGVVALKTGGTSRLSVPSRYKKAFLDGIERNEGAAARALAEARLRLGHQIHHLIPDAVAQKHVLVQEVLHRLKRYTIDRGSNLIDLPSSLKEAKGKIIHRGSHPEYEKFVTKELNKALDRLTRDGARPLEEIEPGLLDDALRQIENELRKAIERDNLPSNVIREFEEQGVPVGRKLGLNINPYREDMTHGLLSGYRSSSHRGEPL